jgi:hypothetical protein
MSLVPHYVEKQIVLSRSMEKASRVFEEKIGYFDLKEHIYTLF